jgi:large subunit ribosomal protein L10
MNKDVLSAKKETVAEIVNQAKASNAVIIAEYRGLTVAQLQELRRALRAENAQMNVYKNSLVERACKELGFDQFDELLSGPNAFFFSESISGAAKVLAKYARRYGESLQIKGGYFEGRQFADKAGVVAISKLPGKEGLVSMLLSCLQAPVRQFACTVKAVADAK